MCKWWWWEGVPRSWLLFIILYEINKFVFFFFFCVLFIYKCVKISKYDGIEDNYYILFIIIIVCETSYIDIGMLARTHTRGANSRRTYTNGTSSCTVYRGGRDRGAIRTQIVRARGTNYIIAGRRYPIIPIRRDRDVSKAAYGPCTFSV